VRLPSDELALTFNLVRIPPTSDASEARRLVAANTKIYERVRPAGGTLYPVSALPLSPADWRDHFGSAFGPLATANKEFDPGTILTPGYEVFPAEGPRPTKTGGERPAPVAPAGRPA
jgi:cytokinin dehydrogenase